MVGVIKATADNTLRYGFTLVELAIVLVIIGLIIGGILVGQDMIKSAEIRATISQYQSYNVATRLFKDKYAALPGDINQQKALEFGFYDRTSVAATGNGDGDGMLKICGNANAVGATQSCERVLFWRDLSTAGLVDGYFQTATNVAIAISTVDLIYYFPEAKMGRGNYWITTSMEGRNFYFLGGITSVAGPPGNPTMTAAIAPFEAYNIDRKIDDGMPAFGMVRAWRRSALGGAMVDPPAAPAAGVCISNVDGTYNQSTEAFANTPACQWLRMPLE